MKNLFLIVVLAALGWAGWHFREALPFFAKPAPSETEETGGPSSSPDRPIGTPHPALESRNAALKAYPGIGIKGSALNRAFLNLYAEAEHNDPALLAQPDWPLTLAARAAKSLGGGAQPTPGTPSPLASEGLKGSALDARPEKEKEKGGGGGKHH